MNTTVKSVFTNVYNEIQYLDSKMCRILSDYRTQKKAARDEASRYKDEKGELAKLLDVLKASARAEIKEADEGFSKALKEKYLPKLRDAMTEYITAAPPAEFMQTLTYYKTFNISMSRAEIEALVHGTAGNYFGLRALAPMAKENHYSLQFVGAEDLAKDLRRIERLALTPCCYAPTEYLSEALDVMDRRPVFRPNGELAYMSPNDRVSELMISGEFRNILKDCDEMGDRWGGSFVPKIEELKDTEEATAAEQHAEAVNDAAAAVSVKTTEWTDLASAMGKRQAEERKRSADIVEQYTKPHARDAYMKEKS